MPKFFFHVSDGGEYAINDEGICLPCVEDAQLEAIRLAAGEMRHTADRVVRHGGWSVLVADETGAPVFEFSATISAARN